MKGFQTLEWIGWNLCLALIPVIIAYPLAWAIDRWSVKKKEAPVWVWVLPLLVWLAFLPNTGYLLTEWRHFLFDPKFSSIRTDDAASDPIVMLRVARQGLFFTAYSAFGVLCYGLAIRPIHQALKRAGVNVRMLAVPFFLLLSLGVYMGLMVRLNSWDIVLRPRTILDVAIHAFTTPLLLETIFAFAAILWVLYIVVDMWVDGFKIRIAKKAKR